MAKSSIRPMNAPVGTLPGEAEEVKRFGRSLSAEERAAVNAGVEPDLDAALAAEEAACEPTAATPSVVSATARRHKCKLAHCCSAMVERLGDVGSTQFRVQVVDLPRGADEQKPVDVDVAGWKGRKQGEEAPIAAFRMACGIGPVNEWPIGCEPLPD